jgi:CRP-like cAMP-binding protein/tetratricopeptide (TPR) repeat protein
MEDDTDLELRARVLKEVEEEDEDVSYDVLFLRECDVPEPHAAATHHEINGKGLSGQMHRTDTFKKPQRRNSQVGLGGNTKCVSHSLGSVTTMSTIGRRKSEAARTMRVVSARERLRAQGKAVVAAASVVSFMKGSVSARLLSNKSGLVVQPMGGPEETGATGAGNKRGRPTLSRAPSQRFASQTELFRAKESPAVRKSFVSNTARRRASTASSTKAYRAKRGLPSLPSLGARSTSAPLGLPDLLIKDAAHAVPPTSHQVRPWDTRLSESIADRERNMMHEAIQGFTTAIAKAPPDLHLKPYFERADTYLLTGAYAKAAEDLTACIRLDPKSAKSLFKRAVAYNYLGKTDKALVDYNACLKLDPWSVDAYHNRALLFRRVGEYDHAKEDYVSLRLIETGKARIRHGRIVEARAEDVASDPFDDDQYAVRQLDVALIMSSSYADDDDFTIDTNLKAGWKGNEVDAQIKQAAAQKRRTATTTQAGAKAKMIQHSRGSDWDDENSEEKLADWQDELDDILNGRPIVNGISSMRKTEEARFDDGRRTKVALQTDPDERTPAMVELLISKSPSVTYLQQFDDELLSTLWERFDFEHVETGTAVVTEGESSNRFYVLLEGECRVMSSVPGMDEKMTIGRLESGQGFGELALLRGVPRNSTVVATKPSELLSLSKTEYLETVHHHELKNMDIKETLIRRCEAFSKWDAPLVNKVAGIARTRKYKEGSAVVKQGAPAEEFYLVKAGLVHIRQTITHLGSLVSVHVATLSSGDFFGETALLEPWGGMSAYSAVCDTYTQLLVINKRQFDHSLMNNTMHDDIRRLGVRLPKVAHAHVRIDDQTKWRDHRKVLLEPFMPRKKKPWEEVGAEAVGGKWT